MSQARDKRMLWNLGFGGFLVNADNRAIAPMLPAIALSLHVSSASAALLVTAYSIPYGLFQLVYGPIADRIGKVNTILAAVALFAVGTILRGVVDTFPSVLILRIVTGIFAAGIIPTTLAQIGDRFELSERPKAIAFFMSLTTSGQALGIVIGGIVAQYLSYRWLFVLIGVGAIPTLFGLLRERNPEGHKIQAVDPLLQRYKAIVRDHRAWLVYGLVLAEGFVFYGGFTFLGVYGVTLVHLSYFVIGLLTATYSLGAFIGSRTISAAIARVTSQRMPVLGAALMTLGFVIIWAWPSVAGLTLGFLVLGYGFSYCHSTLQTHATDLLPGGRATAISVFAFSLFLGSGLGPIVAGSAVGWFGMRGMVLSVGAAMGLFTLMTTTLMRRPREATGAKSSENVVSS